MTRKGRKPREQEKVSQQAGSTDRTVPPAEWLWLRKQAGESAAGKLRAGERPERAELPASGLNRKQQPGGGKEKGRGPGAKKGTGTDSRTGALGGRPSPSPSPQTRLTLLLCDLEQHTAESFRGLSLIHI